MRIFVQTKQNGMKKKELDYILSHDLEHEIFIPSQLTGNTFEEDFEIDLGKYQLRIVLFCSLHIPKFRVMDDEQEIKLNYTSCQGIYITEGVTDLNVTESEEEKIFSSIKFYFNGH